MGATFEFSLTDNSELVKQALPEAKARALEMVGLQVQGYAQMLAPVDTGRLRNSIAHEVIDDTAYIGSNVEYAVYQEMGTSKMAAHPYLRPAVQDHLDEYRRMIEETLKNA